MENFRPMVQIVASLALRFSPLINAGGLLSAVAFHRSDQNAS